MLVTHYAVDLGPIRSIVRGFSPLPAKNAKRTATYSFGGSNLISVDTSTTFFLDPELRRWRVRSPLADEI